MTDHEFLLMLNQERQFPFILRKKLLRGIWWCVGMDVDEIALTELLDVKGVEEFCGIIAELCQKQPDTFLGLKPILVILASMIGMGESTAKAVLSDFIERNLAHSIGVKSALRVKKSAFTTRLREYEATRDAALADRKTDIEYLEAIIAQYQVEKKAYKAMYTGQINLLHGARSALATSCQLAEAFISSKDGIIGLGVLGNTTPPDTETKNEIITTSQNDIKALRKLFFGTLNGMQEAADSVYHSTIANYDSQIIKLRDQISMLVRECYDIPEYIDVMDAPNFKGWDAPKEIIQEMRTAYDSARNARLAYVERQISETNCGQKCKP